MATQIHTGAKKSGGGGILEAIGTIGGIIAAPFTGGASLAGVATGLGVGKTVGSVADKIAGTDARPDEANPAVNAAIERRATSLAPDYKEPSRVLEESLAAIKSPEVSPQARQQIQPVLEQARRRFG